MKSPGMNYRILTWKISVCVYPSPSVVTAKSVKCICLCPCCCWVKSTYSAILWAVGSGHQETYI